MFELEFGIVTFYIHFQHASSGPFAVQQELLSYNQHQRLKRNLPATTLACNSTQKSTHVCASLYLSTARTGRHESWRRQCRVIQAHRLSSWQRSARERGWRESHRIREKCARREWVQLLREYRGDGICCCGKSVGCVCKTCNHTVFSLKFLTT